jgi:hypothetical protein
VNPRWLGAERGKWPPRNAELVVIDASQEMKVSSNRRRRTRTTGQARPARVSSERRWRKDERRVPTTQGSAAGARRKPGGHTSRACVSGPALAQREQCVVDVATTLGRQVRRADRGHKS